MCHWVTPPPNKRPPRATGGPSIPASGVWALNSRSNVGPINVPLCLVIFEWELIWTSVWGSRVVSFHSGMGYRWGGGRLLSEGGGVYPPSLNKRPPPPGGGVFTSRSQPDSALHSPLCLSTPHTPAPTGVLRTVTCHARSACAPGGGTIFGKSSPIISKLEHGFLG